LAQPGCRIKLHFIPAYCPHLDPIERLWGLMHKHVTHNRCHETFADFRTAILGFLREEVPSSLSDLEQKWPRSAIFDHLHGHEEHNAV
jgi:transposase